MTAGTAPRAPLRPGGGDAARITEAEAARITEVEMERAGAIVRRVGQAFAGTVVGQDRLRTSLLAALMAGGHILLESVPGLAKTTAAATLARAVDATFARVQCTPDLLPSDIIGTQMFDASTSTFRTQLGPVHANFVLLDEINRSSAKTQSAMLEAMQERATSIGGRTYPLPQPFMALATQNPIEEEGTYVLPHAQLDRFLLKEVLTYPAAEQEVEVLRRADGHPLGSTAAPTEPVATLADVRFLQHLAARVYVDDAIRRYVVALVHATREPAHVLPREQAAYVEFGASPRGAIALQQTARSLALLDGRVYVVPEDVKALRLAALRHRIVLSFEAVAERVDATEIIEAVFAAVPSP